MNWVERSWKYAPPDYRKDVQRGIELLTRAFEEKLGLKSLMGKEWEFIVLEENEQLPSKEEVERVTRIVAKKIKEANKGLLRLGKGSGYDRFYIDNYGVFADGKEKTPIWEITTQKTTPLHSAKLIDLFQRMLEKQLKEYEYAFYPEVAIVGTEKNVICGLHDNISFQQKISEKPISISENAMERVMQATPAVMLLYAPEEASYERYSGRFPEVPMRINYNTPSAEKSRGPVITLIAIVAVAALKTVCRVQMQIHLK